MGCSVGTRVSIESNRLEYPVSQSSSVYISDGEILKANDYELIADFSYRFKKWGISSLGIDSGIDISDQLNSIIEEKGGDAIVNLDISMRNTAKNSFMLVLKSTAFIVSIAATAITFADPSAEASLIAAGSLATYLFTPANVDIEIRGTVVKFFYSSNAP
jgi:hypothetical protein